jgi:hypothetical protein
MRRYQLPLVSLLFLLLAAVACVREPSGPVIIVTATPPDPIGIQTRQPGDETPVALPTVPPTSAALPQGLIEPTMDPPRLNTPEPLPESYASCSRATP